MERIRRMMSDCARNHLIAADWLGIPRAAAFPKELTQCLED